MLIPMPSPRGTNRAGLFLNTAHNPVFAFDAAPNAAMVGIPDDAPGGDFTGKLIEALHTWAAVNLNPDQCAALNKLVEDNTNQRGAIAGKDKRRARDVEPTRGTITAEGVEQALDFLRTKGFTEDEIDHVRKLEGFPKPTQAQDSARRERAVESYAKQFPSAARIIAATAVERKRPVAASASAAESYARMFPDAARLG